MEKLVKTATAKSLSKEGAGSGATANQTPRAAGTLLHQDLVTAGETVGWYTPGTPALGG